MRLIRNPPHKWTKAQLDQLKALRTEGKGASAIAKVLKLPTGVIDTRIRRIEDRTGKPASTITTRACMCCGGNFRSRGIHNRLCDRCGKQSLSPYAT